MILKRRTEDNDIVNVDEAYFPVESLQDTSHQPSKNTWRINKSKTHSFALVQTIVRNKRSVRS